MDRLSDAVPEHGSRKPGFVPITGKTQAILQDFRRILINLQDGNERHHPFVQYSGLQAAWPLTR